MVMDKKTDRILIRVSEADKERLRQAARADNRSISSFILNVALQASPDAPVRKPAAKGKVTA